MALTPAHNFRTSKSLFGQLIIGPPGSGKTTYCWKMGELLKKCDRKVVTVNLDPANDALPFVPDIDITSLISVEDVMSEMSLGPNGSLMYCMEYLEKNFDWLLEQINSKGVKCYFLFDIPGQVELYSHHESLGTIFNLLQKKAGIQICTVHLVDSHHCSDAGKFISSLTVSLTAMLRIGLPHINILSKVDLLKKHADKLQFGLDFYTEVLDLNYLLETLDSDAFTSKYRKLNAALTSIIEDYSLVSFLLLDVHKEDSLKKVKNMADRVNGFGFGTDESRDMVDTNLERELKTLKDEEIEVDKMIKEYDSRKAEELRMRLLHEYNDLKDAAQAVMGLLATMEGTTVKKMHKRFGIETDEETK